VRHVECPCKNEGSESIGSGVHGSMPSVRDLHARRYSDALATATPLRKIANVSA